MDVGCDVEQVSLVDPTLAPAGLGETLVGGTGGGLGEAGEGLGGEDVAGGAGAGPGEGEVDGDAGDGLGKGEVDGEAGDGLGEGEGVAGEGLGRGEVGSGAGEGLDGGEVDGTGEEFRGDGYGVGGFEVAGVGDEFPENGSGRNSCCPLSGDPPHPTNKVLAISNNAPTDVAVAKGELILFRISQSPPDKATKCYFDTSYMQLSYC